MDSSASSSIQQVIPMSVLPALGPLSSAELTSQVIEESINLHLLAKNNEADKIRAFTNENNIKVVKRGCLKIDQNGNTPAMLAAHFNRKEALLALLAPFFIIPEDQDIDKLLHHKNHYGQNILSLVTLHIDTLFAAHSILIEFEAAAHDWDPYRARLCLRENLGSTQEAMVSLSCLDKIERRLQKHQQQPKLLAKIFLNLFLVKTIFFGLDVITDVNLVVNYWREWGNETIIQKPCVAFKNQSSSLPLHCYSQAISRSERFIGTLVLICGPFALYFFEVLRFRIFSHWLEEVNGFLNFCKV